MWLLILLDAWWRCSCLKKSGGLFQSRLFRFVNRSLFFWIRFFGIIVQRFFIPGINVLHCNPFVFFLYQCIIAAVRTIKLVLSFEKISFLFSTEMAVHYHILLLIIFEAHGYL